MPKVLYLIACAAPPAQNIERMIRLAHDDNWDVCLLATPSGIRFIDTHAMAELTGHPVRSQYKEPDAPDALPEPDAIIVAPATVNTINKWALGICDTLALGILVEGIGKKLPIVALPFTNYAHAAHPAFPESIAKLRSWGVRVLFGPDVYPLHAPGTGGKHIDIFPWALTLEALRQTQPQLSEWLTTFWERCRDSGLKWVARRCNVYKHLGLSYVASTPDMLGKPFTIGR